MLAKRNFVLAVRGDIFGDKPNCLQTLRVHLETIVALVVAVVRNLEQRQRVILQKANIIIILMMMDMTISIWMGITTVKCRARVPFVTLESRFVNENLVL